MFAQEYDYADELSDGEQNDGGNESSDDDDLKRVLRHIGEIEDKVPEEDDFEQSMEDDLSKAVNSLLPQRAPVPVPSLPPASFSSAKSSTSPRRSTETATASTSALDSSTSSPPKKTVKFKEKSVKFYDAAYFDSDDEEPESALKDNGRRSSKKHPILSNDELFYDPKVDEEDQEWVDNERKKYQPQIGRPPGQETTAPPKKRSKESATSNTDAVLNCPACMTTVCLDCQRHEIYRSQYRAMFVMNCSVDKSRSLICKAKKQASSGKKRRTADSAPDEFVAADTVAGQGAAKEDIFFPVKCQDCYTEVGVMDADEVYHFFNVIASHP